MQRKDIGVELTKRTAELTQLVGIQPIGHFFDRARDERLDPASPKEIQNESRLRLQLIGETPEVPRKKLLPERTETFVSSFYCLCQLCTRQVRARAEDKFGRAVSPHTFEEVCDHTAYPGRCEACDPSTLVYGVLAAGSACINVDPALCLAGHSVKLRVFDATKCSHKP